MNKNIEKQLIKCYQKYNFERFHEFCVLNCVSLIESYEIVRDFTDNQEHKEFCQQNIDRLKKFYGVK